MAVHASAQAATPDWKSQFARVSDEYFDQVYFRYAPSGGTMTGYHQYDSQLEDFSRKAIDAEIAALHQFESRIEAIKPDDSAADFVPRSDREIVLANIRSQLLTLETIRPWEKHADNYSSTCANAAFVLMERKFAPPDDRLRSLIAREKQMPSLLAAAHVNLKNPPRIFTDIAIEQLPGVISFFQHDVPDAFADAKDPAVKADFAQSNAAVIAALNDYQQWLKSDVLPRSNGDFRIGADTFQQETPLRRNGRSSRSTSFSKLAGPTLRKNQDHFKQVAAELEPGKDPHAVLEELGEMHPAPSPTPRLLPRHLQRPRRLHSVASHRHLPSDVRPIVEETPPFMRATTFASMDTPGPYETHSTEAYFNVTLPDPSMTPAEVEGYMHGFNVGTRHLHCRARGLSRPLRSVPLAAAGAQQSPQIARRELPMLKAGPTTASR